MSRHACMYAVMCNDVGRTLKFVSTLQGALAYILVPGASAIDFHRWPQQDLERWLTSFYQYFEMKASGGAHTLPRSTLAAHDLSSMSHSTRRLNRQCAADEDPVPEIRPHR